MTDAQQIEEPAALADAPVGRSWRYCIHIAYYGSGFVGWQRQSQEHSVGAGSVQEVVEDAVTELLGAKDRINVTSVSRTDAGTHALYQYGTIRLDEELSMDMDEFRERLNARLPENVTVHGVRLLDAASRPSRIRSLYKKYIYYIQQGHRPDLALGKYSWFIGKRLDVQRVSDALSILVGAHDFRPFTQGLQQFDKSTVRTIISATVTVRRNVVFSLDPATCGNGELMDEEARLAMPSAQSTEPSELKRRKIDSSSAPPVHFICVELIANGFLRHMVRRIIGTLRPIAEGTYPVERMKQVLDGEIAVGPSAPTKGLWLHRTWLTQEDWDLGDIDRQI